MFDIWSLLQPSSLAALACAGALLFTLFRWRIPALLSLFLGLAILIGPVFVNVPDLLAWQLERRFEPVRDLPDDVDGILVLGGAVDWRVTGSRGQLNMNSAAERVIAGTALARRFPDATVAFTGLYREDVAQEFVPTPRATSMFFGDEFRGRPMVFIGESRSTYEDGLLALERLQPRSGETWLLVTSAWHMPRAYGVFRQLGWNVVPYPVDYLTAGEPQLLRFDPRPGALLGDLDRMVREWGALLVYERSGRIAAGGVVGPPTR